MAMGDIVTLSDLAISVHMLKVILAKAILYSKTNNSIQVFKIIKYVSRVSVLTGYWY